MSGSPVLLALTARENRVLVELRSLVQIIGTSGGDLAVTL
jgi:hypothetical protein